MISSNMSRAGHKCRVVVLRGTADAKTCGLLLDSVVMADNIATIQLQEIDRIIGQLPNMSAIDAALRVTFDLD